MTVMADALNGTWFKSSYSNDQGGNCVEAARLTGAEWAKSTYSDNQGGACVEAARLGAGVMAVRDSKDPHGPALVFTAGAWSAFTAAVRGGEIPGA
ncbi:DUF397 domain-containing protein [Actinacidiphila rubida]|uniref:DUF397 domain-containing protein n=1 Tax=Actinacidiphila rubida TaxID=310780 RepID=A0A1H8MQA6_9ACTN|nr:DUF397 domain-containing protein [Actinacidiphila rubida]SEO19450.1 protein of unknown function [Actinacidiphila rubida]